MVLVMTDTVVPAVCPDCFLFVQVVICLFSRSKLHCALTCLFFFFLLHTIVGTEWGGTMNVCHRVSS